MSGCWRSAPRGQPQSSSKERQEIIDSLIPKAELKCPAVCDAIYIPSDVVGPPAAPLSSTLKDVQLQSTGYIELHFIECLHPVILPLSIPWVSASKAVRGMVVDVLVKKPQLRKPESKPPTSADIDNVTQPVTGLFAPGSTPGCIEQVKLGFRLATIGTLGSHARVEFIEYALTNNNNNETAFVARNYLDLVPPLLLFDAFRITEYFDAKALAKTIARYIAAQPCPLGCIDADTYIQYRAARTLFAIEYSQYLTLLGFYPADLHGLVNMQLVTETSRYGNFGPALLGGPSLAEQARPVSSNKMLFYHAHVIELSLRNLHLRNLIQKSNEASVVMLEAMMTLVKQFRGILNSQVNGDFRRQLSGAMLPGSVIGADEEQPAAAAALVSLYTAIVTHTFLDPFEILKTVKKPVWYGDSSKETRDILFYPITEDELLHKNNKSSSGPADADAAGETAFIPAPPSPRSASQPVPEPQQQQQQTKRFKSDPESFDETVAIANGQHNLDTQRAIQADIDQQQQRIILSRKIQSQITPPEHAIIDSAFSYEASSVGIGNMVAWPGIQYNNLTNTDDFIDWVQKRCGAAFCDFLFQDGEESPAERIEAVQANRMPREPWHPRAFVAGGWVLRALVAERTDRGGMFDCDIYALGRTDNECQAVVQSLVRRVHSILQRYDGVSRITYVNKLSSGGVMTVFVEGAPIILQFHTVLGYTDIASYVFDCFDEPHTQCYLSGNAKQGFRIGASAACLWSLMTRVADITIHRHLLLAETSYKHLDKHNIMSILNQPVARGYLNERAIRILKAIMKGFAVRLQTPDMDLDGVVVLNQAIKSLINNPSHDCVKALFRSIQGPHPALSNEQASWTAMLAAQPHDANCSHVRVMCNADLERLMQANSSNTMISLANELVAHIAGCRLNPLHNKGPGYSATTATTGGSRPECAVMFS